MPAPAISLAFQSAEGGKGGRRTCPITLRTLLISQGYNLITRSHVAVTEIGKCGLYSKQTCAQLKVRVLLL